MGGISPAGITMTAQNKTLSLLSSSSSSAANTKDPSIVVFDEAHNIDNVCIEAFSIDLNMMILERARQNVAKLEKEVQK